MKLEQSDFERLRDYMHSQYGINLEKKAALIEGRLSNVIATKGYADFTSYIDFAIKDPDETAMLVSRLTTNYTYFMREEQHYSFLKQQVLPEWTRKAKDKDLRIWSAGCSSGEEAYTAAMVVHDYLKAEASQWDSTILATDISSKVLALARKGIFPEEEMKLLPDEYKKRYFKQVEPGVYEIKEAMRKQVVFAYLNLMDKTFPFKKKFHLIFCRNVMIYFKGATKQELIQKYYDNLHPGGYFFIGMAETMSNLESKFEYIQPAIYRKPMDA